MSDITSYRLDQAEKHADAADARMGRIEDKIDRVADRLTEVAAKLSELPTKRDLVTYWPASVAVGMAVIGITIGGIVGGLSWLH